MSLALASLASNPRVINGVLLAALVGGGGYLLYKGYQAAQQDQGQKALDNSPEAQQANQLLAYLHPYSYKKLSLNPFETLDIARDKLSNVDEEAVIKYARGIKNFEKVRNYYSQLTGNRLNLVDDIRNILNSEEQNKFYKNIELSKSETSENTKPFYVVTAPTNVNGLVATYEDAYMKKPLFSYKAGVTIGKALKKVSVPFKNADGSISKLYLYYIAAEVGQIKGKNIYVLVSQVKQKK